MVEKAKRKAEEEYFQRQEADLLQRMRERYQEEAKLKQLQGEFGVEDMRILQAFEALGFTRETVVLLHVFPLLQVAWADGNISDREKATIEEAAAIRGIVPGTPAHGLLKRLLDSRPTEEMYEAALRAIMLIDLSMPEERRAQTKENLVSLCLEVARASGGFLGLGNSVSTDEMVALERIAKEIAELHPESAKRVLRGR
jgi:hypothetical protein